MGNTPFEANKQSKKKEKKKHSLFSCLQHFFHTFLKLLHSTLYAQIQFWKLQHAGEANIDFQTVIAFNEFDTFLFLSYICIYSAFNTDWTMFGIFWTWIFVWRYIKGLTQKITSSGLQWQNHQSLCICHVVQWVNKICIKKYKIIMIEAAVETSYILWLYVYDIRRKCFPGNGKR